MSELFSEFSALSFQNWKTQVQKDLKGKSSDELIWKDQDDIYIHPYYVKPEVGSNEVLFNHQDFEIIDEIDVQNESTANERALKSLSLGASGICFMNVNNKTNIEVLLNAISIAHIHVKFRLGDDAEMFVSRFKDYCEKQKIDFKALKGAIVLDPIHHLMRTGSWIRSEQEDKKVVLDMHSSLKNIDLSSVSIDSSIFLESGASPADEITFILAHLNEVLNWIDSHEGTNIHDIKNVHLEVAVAGDFFHEIAKLRAIRVAASSLFNCFGIHPALHLHTRIGAIDKSNLDNNNNLIRATTQSMSAILGGSNSICVNSFTLDGSYNSQRLGINQLIVLKEEAWLNKVADVGAGSYYIESLTEQLIELAFNLFKKIEKEGGLITALKHNTIQDKLEKNRSEILKKIEDGSTPLVGVNIHVVKQNTIELKKKSIQKGKEIKPLLTFRYAEIIEANQSVKEKL